MPTAIISFLINCWKAFQIWSYVDAYPLLCVTKILAFVDAALAGEGGVRRPVTLRDGQEDTTMCSLQASCLASHATQFQRRALRVHKAHVHNAMMINVDDLA